MLFVHIRRVTLRINFFDIWIKQYIHTSVPALFHIRFQSPGIWNRQLHLPMIVSIPLLIGLIVLIAGVLTRNILVNTFGSGASEAFHLQMQSSIGLLNNIVYISATLAALAGLFLAIMIVRPLRRLSEALTNLADHGVTDQLDLTATGMEIGDLGQSFNRVMDIVSDSMPERARTVFHNIASGILAFDGAGNLTFINSAADKMLELRGVGIRNQEVRSFLSRFGELDELIEVLETTRTQKSDYSGEQVTIRTISGTEVQLMVTTTTIVDYRNRRTETIATLINSDHVEEINQRIQHNDKLSSLGTLAAGVAHEVRNPLASLRGLTQLLKEDLAPEDPKGEYAEVILKEVDRLNAVVQQLLDFSAVSQEKVQRADLNDLMSRALQLANPALKKKDVRLELELDETLQPVGVYERKMIQAFLNVVLNAIEAAEGEGTVRITSRRLGDFVEFDVANSGSYIDPKTQERIFDPFFTTKDRGTGLGLSTTLQIIRQHEGSIDVTSDPASGTCFTISVCAHLDGGDGRTRQSRVGVRE